MNDSNNTSAAPGLVVAPRIVAIGASAGGLHALSLFFRAASEIPADVAFVVVVHLAPGAESHLPGLLAKDTALPVSAIEDGVIPRAGHVYVIPPKVSVVIEQDAFRLRAAVDRPAIPMPIDAFFTSLAADQRDRAIGIVLTGANADGSAGLRAIKAEGGMVMAQTPDTAEHSAMPGHAIATGLVDYVLPVENMPAALFDYITRSTAGTSLAAVDAARPVDLEPVLRALAAAGSDFRGYKRGTLQRRIARRMAVNRIDSLDAYCGVLSASPEEAQALSLDMMIGVTEFFRDPDAWTALSERVLSVLLEEPQSEQPIRVWVPGCATGEEAYSMAMLLTEEIEKRRVTRPFMILASDVNRVALGRARQGIYSASVASPVGEARLERFFQTHSDGFQIRQELRETVLFTPQNLIADPPFSRVDLISCRNLLIYLEPEAQQRVFELFHFALNPKRYLFLGRSESTDPDSTQFQEVSRAWRIYQRSPVIAPAVTGYRFSASTARREEFPPASRVGVRSKGYAELVNATLLEEHHAASVLINSAHQVLYVSGSTDEYLTQPAGEPTGNILDMARDGLRLKLRIVLRRAVQDQAASPVSEIVADGGAPAVKITVTRPFDTMHAGKALLVIFARLPTADRPASTAPSGADSDLWHLESELRTTQVELGSTIEELEESNSELRVSNEEILSMNEELRSANEELETSKEELQAVNEQLNVVNSQLEQKVHQLEVLSEDVTNLLASTEISTLLIDRQGLIKRFTPSAARILGLAPPDIGRRIIEVLGNPLGNALPEEVDRILLGLDEKVEKEIETATAEWYVRRITPYITVRGMPPAGVVVTWTDITQVKLSDERARRLAAVVQDSNDAVTVFDLKGRFLAWNRAASAMYGYSETEALRMTVSDLVPRGARQDHLDFIHHAEHNEALHSYETQRVTKDGRVVDIWLTLSVLSDDAGNAIAVSSTERDLVNRSVSNAHLRERAEQLAVADRRKNEFLAMLGHELRNPLAALVSAGNLLASETVPVTQKDWAAGVIQRQGRAMMHLVNDMLDITRITSGSIELNRQTVLLKTIVQSAIEVCQPIVDERRHSLSVSLPEEPIWLNADPTRLSQVIENIVINAAKYTAPGGSIQLRATTAAHRLSLSIKDNGRGIPSSMLGSLFDMFVQGPASNSQRNNGLGVGLSVARRLVELHGGSVRAISDGKTGSEFVVDLPLDPGPVPGDRISLQPAPVTARPQRILIVDDNADASEALGMLLANEGHQVETRIDGVSGLSAAETFNPDFVLLDIGLPGMDGYEVARRLRESGANRNVILVAVTGYGLPADRIKSVEAGFDHHLTKPVDYEALIRLFGSGTQGTPRT
ncbi:ATP-binding protein [Paraburkholderia sp. SEWSISQ10-3 4]|uniref:CheR family methyltransferase n=1 Tax=Paraburkholderia TaxID=1822464 RepID=UPI00225C1881|nr:MULTISPECIES: CheR family methyltransferase [Paraburkholderia]MCX4139595.1 ATP-binding protein [Paraburkholderia aspalathi]MDN7172282.1 ATP-binding protein [Paraburkholderia sp. SEWSISQ10-3 4]MDQ6501921.1 ATP-binding protein [Paraburkholderia aspalathi]